MATTSPSIKLIRASDGSGNASAATVQNTRSPGATTIQVDTVQGLPTNFYATMGTPHTFTDPVTGETITIISEATAVDFEGHVDGTNLEIDAIADGYTDNGSDVGDIVVIRPTTPYANNVADVLDVAHNDDGTIKNDAISSQQMFTDDLDPVLRASEIFQNFVASGGVIAQTTGLTASFSDLVYYISGVRLTKTGVANRGYTASKDTYVDIGSDGVLDYTEVANGAASPALSANHIRLAKVVTNGSAITSVTQNSTDTLGNFMRPLSPLNRDLLKGKVAFRASRTSGQSITGPTTAKIQLATEDFDLGANFDNATNYRFVAPVEGIYHLSAGLEIGVSAGDAFGGVVRKNGSTDLFFVGRDVPSVGFGHIYSGSSDIKLVAGDYVELFGYNGRTGANTFGGSTLTYLSGHLVTAL